MNKATIVLVLFTILATQLVSADRVEIAPAVCERLDGKILSYNKTCPNGTQEIAYVSKSFKCCVALPLDNATCSNAMGYTVADSESCKKNYIELELAVEGKKCCVPIAIISEQPATLSAENLTEIQPMLDKESCLKLDGYTSTVIAGCKEGYYNAGRLEDTKSGICCVPLPQVKPVKPGFGLALSNFLLRTRMMFTFNREKKAKLGLKLAERRLALIAYHLEKGDLNKAKRAAKDYNETLERVNKLLENLEEKGDEERAAGNAIERLTELESRVELQRLKLIGTKERILERMRERNMTNVEHISEVFNSIEKRYNLTTTKLLQTKQRVITRLKAMRGADNETLEEVKRLEAKQGLQKYRAIRNIIQLRKASERLKEIENRSRGIVNNSGVRQQLEQQRERIKRMTRELETLRVRYTLGNENPNETKAASTPEPPKPPISPKPPILEEGERGAQKRQS